MHLVPVLNNPASFVEAEDLDSNQVTSAGPMLNAVKHYKIGLRDDAFELLKATAVAGIGYRQECNAGGRKAHAARARWFTRDLRQVAVTV